MSDIDLSGLSDDQLVALARACCIEAIRRGAVTQDVVQDMMLTEAERARVLRNATNIEIAAVRAREREQLALDAAEKVRIEAAKAAAAQAMERAAARAAETEMMERDILRQAAAACGLSPREISVLQITGHYGRRVLINQGSRQYARDHLVDFDVKSERIKTVKRLMAAKKVLIPICAAIAAALPIGAFLDGASYNWE